MQRVTDDAPEQVEVHKIKADIAQALEDLLDEEKYDDNCREPYFDAETFGELPAGATREDFAIGRDEMENINKIVRKLRDDGRDLSNQLRKWEEEADNKTEKMQINIASPLYEAFLKYQERMPIPAEAIGEKSKRPSSEEKKRQQEMNFADEKTTTKKLCELSSADVAAVIETEKTEMLSHGAIASKHKISTALAGRIIRSNKKKKDFIRKRKQKEEDNEEKKNAIK